MKRFARVHFLYLLAIAIGTGIYAFGFVAFNIFNSIEDVKKNPLIAYALLDGRNVSQGLAPYMNQALTDYVNQQNRLWGKN
ncbi:hypothetical protein [Streptosporangium roseum]|uniref:hypothetical protein n=1 Tax=Streptosporangium roseum TaxID=2001 RepID=UPI0033291F14